MKKALIFLSVFILFSISAMAQTKKDGTPDMRYKANRQSYSTPSYSAPSQSSQRNYSNGGQYRVQNGYQKQNGTYVSPHLKTTPDNKKWNNKRPSNF